MKYLKFRNIFYELSAVIKMEIVNMARDHFFSRRIYPWDENETLA